MWHHHVAKELPTRTSRTGNNREAQNFCLARDKFQRARDVKYEDCVDKWMIGKFAQSRRTSSRRLEPRLLEHRTPKVRTLMFFFFCVDEGTTPLQHATTRMNEQDVHYENIHPQCQQYSNACGTRYSSCSSTSTSHRTQGKNLPCRRKRLRTRMDLWTAEEAWNDVQH